jgi:hypothetical protein
MAKAYQNSEVRQKLKSLITKIDNGNFRAFVGM